MTRYIQCISPKTIFSALLCNTHELSITRVEGNDVQTLEDAQWIANISSVWCQTRTNLITSTRPR